MLKPNIISKVASPDGRCRCLLCWYLSSWLSTGYYLHIQDSWLYPTHNEVVWGGILVSHRPSVCPSCIPCPLCSAYISGWIHFIFIHLIKQLQKVCRMQSFLQNFKNLNFWQFSKICYFDFVLFWHGIWYESVVWVIMEWWGVSQNAGVLVVLVIHIDRLVWKRHNSIANTLELRLFGTDPSILDYLSDFHCKDCKQHTIPEKN